MKNELKIRLFSYDHRLLDDVVRNIMKSMDEIGVKVRGPIPLPTKKEIFTICRSPHVNKPSREQFERRTHKRLLIIDGNNSEVIKKLKSISLASGIEIKISL